MNPVMKARVIQLTFFSLLLLIVANAVIFTWQHAFPFVRADGWRYSNLFLRPWLEGQLRFFDLWQDHHPQPVTAVFFIINAELWGLRMDYEAIALSVLSICTIPIMWGVITHDPSLSRKDQKSLLFISALVLFSLNSIHLRVWSLVAVGYLPLMGCLYFFLKLNELENKDPLSKLIFLTLIATLLLVLFFDTARIYWAAMACALIIAMGVEREKKRVKQLIVISISYVLGSIALSIIRPKSSYGFLELLNEIPLNPLDFTRFISYLGIGLSSTWFDAGTLKSLIGVESGALFFGLISFGLYSAITILYLVRRGLGFQPVPVALVLVSLAVALGGYSFRFDADRYDLWHAAIDRYYLGYAVGMIGVIWMVWSVFRESKNGALLLRALMVFLLGSQIFLSFAAWQKSDSLKTNTATTIEVMRCNAAGDYSRVPRGHLPKSALLANHIGGWKKTKYKEFAEFFTDVGYFPFEQGRGESICTASS